MLAALALRIVVVLATPHYQLVHDAIDYDHHARSLAAGHGFALSYGRPTAFRPPAYPIFLAGVYWLFGADVEAGRIANAFVGAGIVALIGVLAFQFWDRRTALVAMALAAVYVPLILVGQSIMSEPLFTLCMLAAIALRRRPFLAGILLGLAILGRANAVVLIVPLAFAVGLRRSAILVVAAVLTVAPWTIRNEHVLHHFVPVSTQLGSALAGTYNDEARTDRQNPASWRSLKRVAEYKPIFKTIRTTNEAVLEQRIRKQAIEYIKRHRAYVGTVAWWTTLRILDLGGLDWARHTATTISVSPGWGMVGVVCFWCFALLALAGAFTRRARAAPPWLWAVPLLMYLSVVFLVVETPRYRTAIDPFIVLLAALALTRTARTPSPTSSPPSRPGSPERPPTRSIASSKA